MEAGAFEVTIARNLTVDPEDEDAANAEIDQLVSELREDGWHIIDTDFYDKDGFL